ncbi:MAG TPA: O-acetyl-ADP-ribose deacetylase [Jatrophihabitantaceae bacterium]|jgi:O-acetyl-ADP-ribose deacetylase (regulator of RNase III)|nr:O-acetyl-ADP-ribose deacetylase [Jatrophihabitantaceae bacterium]
MKLTLVHADITEQRVDAIVNAANSSLFGGGGVDGAIHKRGGKAILAECRQLRDTVYPDGLPAGQAVATTAGKLHARWVIHTVGPIYRRGDSETLRSCYRSALAVAAELGATTVAFPLISAGAFGWPVEDAIYQAVAAIDAAPNEGEARLVLLQPATYELARSIVDS